MDCPSIDQLYALAQNQLSDSEAERMRTHLGAECTRCQQLFDKLHRVLTVTAGRSLIEPPDWLIQQVRALFNREKSKAQNGLVERIRGFLVIDSFAEGRLLGFRGAGPSSRHMLYRAGGYEVDLSIDYLEASQSVEIIGQSMPVIGNLSAVAGAGVDLLDGSNVAASTRMNEFGEFILDDVREGVYDLRIRFKDAEINIAALQAVSRPSAKPGVSAKEN